jgi:hypothetical protein
LTPPAFTTIMPLSTITRDTYDPTIGRFISPDTVIQSVANPQCLNRYSYCLNNPLKYTDPSGHDVSIYGINMENWSYNDLINLLQGPSEKKEGFLASLDAWDSLKQVAPELTQALLDEEATVNITIGDITTWGSTSWDGKDITLNEDLLIMDSRYLVSILGHECFHSEYVLFGFTPSDADEIYAQSFGHWVGDQLGLDTSTFNEFGLVCSVVKPDNIDTYINNHDAIIESASNNWFYSQQLKRFPTWPALVTDQTTIGIAQQEFTDWVDSIWKY